MHVNGKVLRERNQNSAHTACWPQSTPTIVQATYTCQIIRGNFSELAVSYRNLLYYRLLWSAVAADKTVTSSSVKV